MNRSRINLILGVLLSPITDPKFQEKDYFYERCVAYKELISVRGTNATILAEKAERNSKFRKATENLIQFLVDSCRSKVQSYDDIYMLCELFYPLLDMDRYIRQVQQNIKLPQRITSSEKENIALFYMKQMQRIALSLLTFRDGIMAIRTWNNRETEGEKDIFCFNHVFDKVEIWNMLNLYVATDIFMALFVVESGLGEEALFGQKPYISLPDKLLVKILRKGMAENHLHFNAGFDYEAVWLNKVNLWNCFQIDWKHAGINMAQDIDAALFRLLCVVFLLEKRAPKIPFLSWIEEFQNGVFIPVIENLYTGKTNPLNVEELANTIWNILNEELVRKNADYLLQTVLFSKLELKTSSEFLLLYYCCLYVKNCPWDTGFVRVFLQYIRIKNLFIHRAQQSNLIPGLKYFQRYFNQMKHEEILSGGRNTMMLDVFRSQSKIDGLQKLEIRIAPDVDLGELCSLNDRKYIEEVKIKLYKQLFNIFALYRKYILENFLGVPKTQYYLEFEQKKIHNGDSYLSLTEELLKNYEVEINATTIPVLGIVYHFLKMDSTDNISGYYCWRYLEKNEGDYSNHRFFIRERIALLGIAIEELRFEIPKMNEYIVGVDAASDENAMEPWMFSMAYMKMRSKNTSRPIAVQSIGGNRNYYSIQNIGFTYHVGEDYRHIISGLRHIDEVIEQFFYKPGDRLGHALALGVNIRDWIQETEVVVLPVQEYMENLLWIWGKSTSGEVDIPVQLERLEEKIFLCAEKIYKNLSGISVRLLYQAYKKKFSSKHKELLTELQKDECTIFPKTYDNNSSIKSTSKTYCKLINTNCNGYDGLWTVERLVSTIYCPVFEERGNQVEMVPVKSSELELFEKLQKHLQMKVAQKGIYIETNPTSNLNVGNMKELTAHPIFRLSPLKQVANQEMSILVTINSDDPAVFNTNVENELAYVYYALQHAGYSKESILQWIDKVRQNGVDGSFIHKIKSCRVLLEEISLIMDSLKKYC